MPKKRSLSEKVIDNNPGKRDLSSKARPVPGRPAEPKGLDAPGLGEWRRLTDALQDSGKLQLSDAGLLLDAAIAYQRICEAEKTISIDGLMVKGDHGGWVKHPACQLSRDYAVRYQKAVQLLGLNAGTREDVPKAAIDDAGNDLD
jgi:P27 family predicted phage terminase small subunit